MPEQSQQWPRTLFSKDEKQNPVTDSVTGEVLCGSRAFQSQAEVDAAGGNAVWHETPEAAQQTQPRDVPGQPPGARPQPAPPVATSRPPQPPDPDDEDEPPPSVPRRR